MSSLKLISDLRSTRPFISLLPILYLMFNVCKIKRFIPGHTRHKVSKKDYNKLLYGLYNYLFELESNLQPQGHQPEIKKSIVNYQIEVIPFSITKVARLLINLETVAE